MRPKVGSRAQASISAWLGCKNAARRHVRRGRDRDNVQATIRDCGIGDSARKAHYRDGLAAAVTPRSPRSALDAGGLTCPGRRAYRRLGARLSVTVSTVPTPTTAEQPGGTAYFHPSPPRE